MGGGRLGGVAEDGGEHGLELAGPRPHRAGRRARRSAWPAQPPRPPPLAAPWRAAPGPRSRHRAVRPSTGRPAVRPSRLTTMPATLEPDGRRARDPARRCAASAPRRRAAHAPGSVTTRALVGGEQAVDGQQPERRRAIDEHEVVIDALDGHLEAVLGADRVVGELGFGRLGEQRRSWGRRRAGSPGRPIRCRHVRRSGRLEHLADGAGLAPLASTSSMVAARAPTPRARRSRCLGSRSMTSTRWPARASSRARPRETVVFPTPPFWFTTAMAVGLREPGQHPRQPSIPVGTRPRGRAPRCEHVGPMVRPPRFRRRAPLPARPALIAVVVQPSRGRPRGRRGASPGSPNTAAPTTASPTTTTVRAQPGDLHRGLLPVRAPGRRRGVCGELEVPLDRAHPDEDTITVAVARIRTETADEDAHADPLLRGRAGRRFAHLRRLLGGASPGPPPRDHPVRPAGHRLLRAEPGMRRRVHQGREDDDSDVALYERCRDRLAGMTDPQQFTTPGRGPGRGRSDRGAGPAAGRPARHLLRDPPGAGHRRPRAGPRAQRRARLRLPAGRRGLRAAGTERTARVRSAVRALRRHAGVRPRPTPTWRPPSPPPSTPSTPTRRRSSRSTTTARPSTDPSTGVRAHRRRVRRPVRPHLIGDIPDAISLVPDGDTRASARRPSTCWPARPICPAADAFVPPGRRGAARQQRRPLLLGDLQRGDADHLDQRDRRRRRRPRGRVARGPASPG